MSELSLNPKTTAITLPNGKIQVIKSDRPGAVGKIFETKEEFYKEFPNINEGGRQTITTLVLDTINE